MSRLPLLLSLLSCLLMSACLGVVSQAAEPKSSEKLKKAIEAAHILKDTNISISLTGTEAMVSAYANDDSADIYKINAVLIAKEVLKEDPDLAKVRVRFFSLDRKNFKAITVTAGDIAAFSSAQLDRERLLASLDLIPGTIDSAQTTTKATAKNLQTGNVKVSRRTAAKKSEPEAAATSEVNAGDFVFIRKTNYSLVSVAGVAFYCPVDWSIGRAHEDEVLALSCSTRAKKATVSLEVYEGKGTPESHLDAHLTRTKERFAQHHIPNRIYQPQPIGIGYGGKIRALSEVIDYIERQGYHHWGYENQQASANSTQGERYIDCNRRYVFFGQPGRTLRFKLSAEKESFMAANRDFNYMLGTLCYKQ